MPQLSYAEILERVKNEGGIEGALKGTSSGGSGFGGEGEGSPVGELISPQDLVGRSIEIEVQQLPVIEFPMEDFQYSSGVKKGKNNNVNSLLSVKDGNGGKINDFKKGTGQVIISSNRLIMNASKEHLMMFGKEGVAVASPGPVNMDSETSITLFGEKGLFLGVPNKGEPIKAEIPPPKSKGDATPDDLYEPLVLGVKLANILEDFLLILKNANIITPIGQAYFREDTQWELASLQARIPEMLSTFAYVDGISHNKPDPAPPAPEKLTPYPTKLVGTITALGDSSINSSTSTNNLATGPIASPLAETPGFFESLDLFPF
jgi:hypothetical protein